MSADLRYNDADLLVEINVHIRQCELRIDSAVLLPRWRDAIRKELAFWLALRQRLQAKERRAA
jgi:hypothetical protein